MSKFRVHLKLQGLEIEVEGTRDDVPKMTHALGEGLSRLLQQPAMVVELPVQGTDHPADADFELKPKRKRNTRARSENGTESSAGALTWKHNPAKWGSAQQTWNTLEKTLWLMHVAEHEAATTEFSASLITNTFNQLFRQAGKVRASNVSRDLGQAKGKTPSLVGENTTTTPGEWFLTDAGRQRAKELVATLLSGVEPEVAANGSSKSS